MASQASRRDDELAAICAIYGDDVRSQTRDAIDVRVAEGVRVSLTLPNDYPAAAPLARITADGAPRSACDAATRLLADFAAARAGEECLLEVLQEAPRCVEDARAAAAATTAPTPPPVADAYQSRVDITLKDEASSTSSPLTSLPHCDPPGRDEVEDFG